MKIRAGPHAVQNQQHTATINGAKIYHIIMDITPAALDAGG